MAPQPRDYLEGAAAGFTPLLCRGSGERGWQQGTRGGAGSGCGGRGRLAG